MKSTALIQRLCALLALCFIALSPALASPPRMSSMGMDTETYWMLQGDTTIVDLNPAELALFNQEIWIRLKGTTDVGAGVIIGLAPDANLQLSTGRPLSVTRFQELPVSQPVITQEQANLMLAFPVDKMYVGFAGSYTTLYAKNDIAEIDNSKTIWTAGGGLFMNLGEKATVDAAAKIISYNIDHQTGGNPVYQAETFDITAFGRLNWKHKPGSILHAALSYSFLDRTYTPAAGGEIADIINQFTLGVSNEFQITAKTLMYVGVQGSVSQNNADAGDTRDMYIKAAGGMESVFSKNLVVRFGANRKFFNSVENANNETSENLEVPATVNVGIGLTIGELVFDLEIEKKLLSSGPDFIAGVAPGPWTADFVAIYHLGEYKPRAR